jgi:hypothetical protein
MEKELILISLCNYFRLPYDSITYMQRTEMLFVYKYAAVHFSGGLDVVLSEVDRLHKLVNGRSKRQRLHNLFYYCQMREMKESGRYDTTTLNPPRPTYGRNGYEY